MIEAAEGGEALTYLSTGPLEGAQGSRNPELTQIVAHRGAQGWSSTDIVTPSEKGEGLGIGGGGEYRFFTPDLSQALVAPFGSSTIEEPPLSKQATERTMYMRDNAGCEADPEGCYTPLVTGQNVPAGTQIGNAARSSLPRRDHRPLTRRDVLRGEAHQHPARRRHEPVRVVAGRSAPARQPAPGGHAGELRHPRRNRVGVLHLRNLMCRGGRQRRRADQIHASGWGSLSTIDLNGGLTSVSCSSPTFCVAVDKSGQSVTYAPNAKGEPKWGQPLSIPGVGSLTSVSCVSSTFCVAVDANGDAVLGGLNGSQEMQWGAAATPDAGAA